MTNNLKHLFNFLTSIPLLVFTITNTTKLSVFQVPYCGFKGDTFIYIIIDTKICLIHNIDGAHLISL